MTFTTELLVSELVTNAIRHAQSPIQLRIILDGVLSCEVFDGSNTARTCAGPTATTRTAAA